MMWISPEQINEQIRSDRDEFSKLSADMRVALKIQVGILRRSHRHAPQSIDAAMRASAA